MRIRVMPVPQLSDAEAKFISMSRVLEGTRAADYAAGGGEDPIAVGARFIAGRPFSTKRSVIATPAARLLRVAWQTELAARIGDKLDDPGLRLATLQTLPVQVYYALFSAARALTEVAGAPRDTHAKLHTQFADEHYRRAPGSWGVRLSGDPEDLSTCVLEPQLCTPVSFNPMEIRNDPAEYVWAALRMARRWRIERAREAWLGNSRNRTKLGMPYKKLPGAVRDELVARERPTTILDFLYELRCGTNYRSIDEYAVDIPDDRVRDFHQGLGHLMNLGLLAYEGQIALYVGSAEVRRVFDEWATRVSAVGPWATAAGAARIDALAATGL